MNPHSSTEHISHTNLQPAHSESLTDDRHPASHFGADKDYISQFVRGNAAHVFIHSNTQLNGLPVLSVLSVHQSQHANIH
jgi:hypothetical protein